MTITKMGRHPDVRGNGYVPYYVVFDHTGKLAYDHMGGRYHGRSFPHAGLKVAREIGTITYRSGPEWEERFGRQRRDGNIGDVVNIDKRFRNVGRRQRGVRRGGQRPRAHLLHGMGHQRNAAHRGRVLRRVAAVHVPTRPGDDVGE